MVKTANAPSSQSFYQLKTLRIRLEGQTQKVTQHFSCFGRLRVGLVVKTMPSSQSFNHLSNSSHQTLGQSLMHQYHHRVELLVPKTSMRMQATRCEKFFFVLNTYKYGVGAGHIQ